MIFDWVIEKGFSDIPTLASVCRLGDCVLCIDVWMLTYCVVLLCESYEKELVCFNAEPGSRNPELI
jgi:hypothetical protein